MNKQPKILAIGGVTASGKTECSIAFAQKYNGAIINCDSRQIYTHFTIGTAKPSIEKKNKDGSVSVHGITHHLLDFISPETHYSLAEYKKDAITAINTILSKGQLPIISGGTGLYMDAVIHDYALPNEHIDRNYRQLLSRKTLKELQSILVKLTPSARTSMNPSDWNNTRRIIRAIEKHSYSSSHKTQRNTQPYRSLYLVLDIPDDELENRIAMRVDHMFANGLEEENRVIRKLAMSETCPARSSIGYKEFDAYFSGNQTLEETRELIILHTRQYAKRQRTWFRRNPQAVWIKNSKDAYPLVSAFLAEA